MSQKARNNAGYDTYDRYDTSFRQILVFIIYLL